MHVPHRRARRRPRRAQLRRRRLPRGRRRSAGRARSSSSPARTASVSLALLVGVAHRPATDARSPTRSRSAWPPASPAWRASVRCTAACRSAAWASSPRWPGRDPSPCRSSAGALLGATDHRRSSSLGVGCAAAAAAAASGASPDEIGRQVPAPGGRRGGRLRRVVRPHRPGRTRGRPALGSRLQPRRLGAHRRGRGAVRGFDRAVGAGRSSWSPPGCSTSGAMSSTSSRARRCRSAWPRRWSASTRSSRWSSPGSCSASDLPRLGQVGVALAMLGIVLISVGG